jgi:hypothetical protein
MMQETTRHREAFNAYWSMGAERSIEKLHATWKGRARAPSLRTLYEWSRALHWQDRILEMERAAREQDRLAHVEALHEMNERHRKEGLALQQRALERFGAMAPGDMKATDAIRALTEGVRLERLAAGAPTERIQQEGEIHGTVELRGFSNQELRRLAELAERRAAGTGEEEPEQPA